MPSRELSRRSRAWPSQFRKGYWVPCESLKSILRSWLPTATYIDLVAISIAGGELKALETFDWRAVSVGVFVVHSVNDPYIDRLLSVKGYCLAFTAHGRSFYAGQEFRSKCEAG